MASASSFIGSVGDSATEIDHATKEAEVHGESVAKAGRAVTTFAQKLKSRCAVLLRRAMLADVGGYDEDLFAYCEDTDLGLRARLAGWRCRAVRSGLRADRR